MKNPPGRLLTFVCSASLASFAAGPLKDASAIGPGTKLILLVALAAVIYTALRLLIEKLSRKQKEKAHASGATGI